MAVPLVHLQLSPLCQANAAAASVQATCSTSASHPPSNSGPETAELKPAYVLFYSTA